MLFGNADIAGQRTFQATAHGVAVNGGNRHTPEGGQRGEGLAELLGHFVGPGAVAIGKGFQVRPGGEKFLTLAGDHQREDVAVGVEVFNGGFQSRQGVCRPGIGRRVSDGQDRNVIALFQLNQFAHGKFLWLFRC